MRTYRPPEPPGILFDAFIIFHGRRRSLVIIWFEKCFNIHISIRLYRRQSQNHKDKDRGEQKEVMFANSRNESVCISSRFQ